jgi:hypothetical protein
VRYTTIRQDAAERVAMSTRRYVLDNPAMSSAAAWRWEALGARALPVIRELYDEPQELPRLAALRAGARLDDPLVTPHLIEMAESGSADARRRAIKLLTGMGTDPRIDLALQELLNDDDLEVRLAAYEVVVGRAGPAVHRFVVGDKFVVDVVASNQPMIYITQAGMPRVAIFGIDLSVKIPLTVTTWSRRFMMMGDGEDEQVEVYYRPPDTSQGVTHLVDARIAELVRFLGRTTTPDNPLPGLGFSYSEVVGVLHQIWRQGYLEADFRPEQDRILASDRSSVTQTLAGPSRRWPMSCSARRNGRCSSRTRGAGPPARRRTGRHPGPGSVAVGPIGRKQRCDSPLRANLRPRAGSRPQRPPADAAGQGHPGRVQIVRRPHRFPV